MRLSLLLVALLLPLAAAAAHGMPIIGADKGRVVPANQAAA